jgi:1-acyl-sn-glycerol-3-phosphate acyltransferase
VADQFLISQSGEITYSAPSGYPLGTNRAFTVCAAILIPLLNLIVRRDWQGVENIPKIGGAIVASNHLSYADPLLFAQFLYLNGRALDFLASEVFLTFPLLEKFF